jgi:hypothetical protein
LQKDLLHDRNLFITQVLLSRHFSLLLLLPEAILTVCGGG